MSWLCQCYQYYVIGMSMLSILCHASKKKVPNYYWFAHKNVDI